MSYFAKTRLSYYKDYKSDIWGLVRNNLQLKFDKTSYNIINLFSEGKHVIRQSLIKKSRYKWKTFIVANTIICNKYRKKNIIKNQRHWSFKEFKLENRVKSILYFYLLFYFFRTKITNRLYHIYKIFHFNKKKYLYNKSKYFRTPFIYEPRIYNVQYKRLKKGEEYLSLQLVRLFYIIYTFKQLKSLIKKVKRADFIFEDKFILLMECKLPSFIYRSSFFSNMFESINFIKSGSLWINKKMVYNLYYTIKVMDFVGFCISSKSFIFWTFFKRIRRRAFLFLFPKYMFISLVFFLIILIRLPKSKEFINPISIDMYRAVSYI